MLYLAAAVTGTACAHRTTPATATGQAMGGEVRVVVRCPSVADHPACLAAAVAARAEVERIEALATDWGTEGEIARLNATGGPVNLSPEVGRMLDVGLRLARATDGAFDPTVGALWGLWDFEAGAAPTDEALAERLPRVGWRALHVEGGRAWLDAPGVGVTLGALAQGEAAAAALATIPTAWEAMVDVSGDVAVRGAWTIGVQHPRRPRGELMAEVRVRDALLITSGDYNQGFESAGEWMHHVLDPRTGRPARGAVCATVVARAAALADGLATALMVTGPDDALVSAFDAWALVPTPSGVLELGQRAAGVVSVSVVAAPSPSELSSSPPR